MSRLPRRSPSRLKIALILPRTGLYRYRVGAFARHLRYAPLTLPTLAALVPEELNAEVTMYDEGTEQIEKERLRADIVGLTATTGASMRAYGFADYFRASGMTVVMGGPHATLMPEEAKAHVDSVVTGPAYETWPALLRERSAGGLKPFYHAPKQIDFRKVPLVSLKPRVSKTSEAFLNSHKERSVLRWWRRCWARNEGFLKVLRFGGG